MTRGEIDGVAKDSFWQEMALLFNDPTFKPHKSVNTGDADGGKSRYKALDISHNPYTLDAEKAKKEFGDLRGAMTKALVNYRKSGMGEDMSEEKKLEDSYALYDSTFYRFCNNSTILEYMYDLFLPLGILESATAEMPAATKFSSDSNRSVRGERVMRYDRDSSFSRCTGAV